jgi:hypothetical protein
MIVEKLETELSSSEIFAALLEWELAGKVRPMPGKLLAASDGGNVQDFRPVRRFLEMRFTV